MGAANCRKEAVPDSKHVTPGCSLLPEVAWDRRSDHGGACQQEVGDNEKWPNMHASARARAMTVNKGMRILERERE